jgi:predicted NAD/FAD-dependent oxidoreductase
LVSFGAIVAICVKYTQVKNVHIVSKNKEKEDCVTYININKTKKHKKRKDKKNWVYQMIPYEDYKHLKSINEKDRTELEIERYYPDHDYYCNKLKSQDVRIDN